MNSPVPVEIWELGNELDWSAKNEVMNISSYISKCRKIIKSVRKIDPNAKIAVQAATAPWSRKRFYGYRENWRNWHRKLLYEIGPLIDYIAFHPYYLGISLSKIEKYLDDIKEDIKNITGKNRIKLFISEHAVWPSKPINPLKKWSDNWHQTHSLGGCLGTANFLNLMLSRTDIGAMCYHCFSGGPWAVILRGKKSGALYTTGIYTLLKIYQQIIGDTVVKADIYKDGDEIKSDKIKLSVVATLTPKGLKIIVVNRGKFFRNVIFKFNNRYNIVNISKIFADSIDNHNKETGAEIKFMSLNKASNQIFDSALIPPETILFFDLRRSP